VSHAISELKDYSVSADEFSKKMTCHQILNSPEESQAALPREHEGDTSFEPVVDTFEHRIIAYTCLSRFAGTPIPAIHAAARQPGRGLYVVDLVHSSVDDPEIELGAAIEAVFDCGLRPVNLVFGMTESELARDPSRSHSIRDFLRAHRFGFALTHAGADPGTSLLQTASDFAPDYIRLDRCLVRSFDQPRSPPRISRLVRIAERSGARVIAEGVDRVRTVENLWLLGVRFMQGHLFGEPSARIE
jgi:EAL domain